jgi:hypothetical protein
VGDVLFSRGCANGSKVDRRQIDSTSRLLKEIPREFECTKIELKRNREESSLEKHCSL